MVKDPKQVKKLFQQFFKSDGKVKVLPSGVVNVDGTVGVRAGVTLPDHRLPIKFGHVTGNFSFLGYSKLASLEGSPDWVGGYFDCSLTSVSSLQGAPQRVDGVVDVTYCDLKNFVGGPKQVGSNYWGRRNSITSLEGLPDHIPGELDFDFSLHLPLLRSLVAEKVEVMKDVIIHHSVTDILNKYVGQGKAGAIRCAGELIKAGYKDNARW